MAFPPLGNSDHFVVLACIDFPSNSKGNGYSRAVWDVLHDNLRDFPWDDIFKLVLLLLLVHCK